MYEFSKVAEYMVNTDLLLSFYILATNSWKFKILNTVYNRIKNKNFLGINLVKYVRHCSLKATKYC